MTQVKDFPERGLSSPPKPDDFLYLITQGSTDWQILINVLMGRELTKTVLEPLYTLENADTYHTLRFVFPAGKVITVPQDLTVQFTPGIIIRLRNASPQPATILPQTVGVKINTKSGLIIPPHGEVNLTNVGPDEWDASGDLTV